jgi:hypothetical protein
MQAAEMKFLCSIGKVTKRNKIRTEVIQSMKEIGKRRLEWYGHVKERKSTDCQKEL